MKITVVHQGALGDTILIAPLLQSLRQRFRNDGQNSLTLVTRSSFGQLLTMLGFTDAYASNEDRDYTRWCILPESPDTPNSLPSWADCDLLISAVSSPTGPWALNARLALAKIKNRTRPIEDSLFFFNPLPPADFPEHITAWHRQQLAALALTPSPPPLARLNPDGPILIHPGSGGIAKCWPRENFLALGHTLKRNGLLPTFILGEAEQERWGAKYVQELQSEFSWYLHMGLYELAEKISRARLFLGNDSGVTHLAALTGVPVITLFGPSNDIQWRPVGPSVNILRAPAPEDRNLEALPLETVLNEMLAELRKTI